MPDNTTEKLKYCFTITRNFVELYRRQGVFCLIVDQERWLTYTGVSVHMYLPCNFVHLQRHVDMFSIKIIRTN